MANRASCPILFQTNYLFFTRNFLYDRFDSNDKPVGLYVSLIAAPALQWLAVLIGVIQWPTHIIEGPNDKMSRSPQVLCSWIVVAAAQLVHVFHPTIMLMMHWRWIVCLRDAHGAEFQ